MINVVAYIFSIVLIIMFLGCVALTAYLIIDNIKTWKTNNNEK